MEFTVRGVVRAILAGSLIAVISGCATSGTKVSCGGKLTPINPPVAKAAGTQGGSDQPSQEPVP